MPNMQQTQRRGTLIPGDIREPVSPAECIRLRLLIDPRKTGASGRTHVHLAAGDHPAGQRTPIHSLDTISATHP